MASGEKLATILQREIDNLNTLQSIVDREYEALADANIPAIEALIAEKNRALHTQAELAKSRQDIVQQHSFDDTPDGLLRFIDECDNRDTLSTAYRHLSTLARDCRDSNRANGRLISQKQRHAADALDVLRKTDSKSSLYSSQGKTSLAGEKGRTLGKV